MGEVAELRRRLGAGEASVGSWLRLGSPAAAEIMAQLGFEWLIVEGEHAAAGPENVQAVLQAMRGFGAVPVLRVYENNPALVKMYLDVGVRGVMFPMVNSAEQARAAVRACKYPPEGVRGIGPGRGADFGLRMDEYMRTANEETLVFIIVEHEQAVAAVDEILAVPGIDAVFFGFADYAASIGLTWQNTHPRVLEARDRVVAAAKRAGVPLGHHAGDVAEAKRLAQAGFQVLTVGADSDFIIAGGRAAAATLKG